MASGKFQICSQMRFLCYSIKNVTQCIRPGSRSEGREMGSSMDDNKEGISTGMLKALVVDSSCAMIPGLQLALDVT